MPDIKVTSAPLAAATLAIAYPILPLDLFVKYLTGSILSIVGPAVIIIFLPTKSFSYCSKLTTLSTITSGDASFPLPVSPHASLPLSGSTKLYPYSFNVDIFLCIIGFSYMFVFIAGAISTLAFVAATVVVSISSQIPFAIFPITFAVDGATKNKSAFFARDICSTSHVFGSWNISLTT